MLHDIQELRLDPVLCGVDVVVSGSHRPRIETIDGVLYLDGCRPTAFAYLRAAFVGVK